MEMRLLHTRGVDLETHNGDEPVKEARHPRGRSMCAPYSCGQRDDVACLKGVDVAAQAGDDIRADCVTYESILSGTPDNRSCKHRI